MGGTHEILIPDKTRWLADPSAQQVCDVIAAAGHSILFVGGCVRNALMGLPDSDVDMSTDALPQEVMALAEAAGLKAIPTGIDHGTVTVIAGARPFEVTTFRRDVETDGRRAVVAFSTDITDDARRRDFTMNALYATAQGRLVDPLGGLPDLLARRVRFIEDPVQRIREDYLRILRFFRFSAYYADPAEGFDADTLAAIGSNLAGLETLSAERVGREMLRLLAARDPAPAVAAMGHVGALGTILPGAEDRWLAPLVHLEGLTGIAADPLTRLAILGGQEVATRFRLSKAEKTTLETLVEAGFGAIPLQEVAYRQGLAVARQSLLIRCAVAGQAPEGPLLETLSHAAAAQFPLKAADLMPEYEGPALGAKLKELEALWIASGFTLDAQALRRRA
ncbi:MAG: CCA tRNA nucleotidyltransferase [Sulfitobacter sp.]|nr:CCA tRNA nucleotidyltransferase [Sulfitobacter sp.]